MQGESAEVLASLDVRVTAVEATLDHLATKADLASLELALRADMAALETALRSDMAALETALLTDMAALKATVTTAGWSLGILIAIAAILPQVGALIGQFGGRSGGGRLAEAAGE